MVNYKLFNLHLPQRTENIDFSRRTQYSYFFENHYTAHHKVITQKTAKVFPIVPGSLNQRMNLSLTINH